MVFNLSSFHSCNSCQSGTRKNIDTNSPIEGYTIDVVTEYFPFKNLKNDWNRLAKSEDSLYPFLCFEWFELWFRSFLKKNLLNIYVLSDVNGIRAIMPLVKCETVFGTILKLAANDHSNKIEIISDKKDLPRYVEAFMKQLLSENFLLVYLEDLLADSEPSRLILEFLRYNQSGHILEKRFVRESVFLDTSTGWQAFRLSLPKKLKKNIRNQKNRLARAGEVQIIKYAKKENIAEAFQGIEEISAKSWQGKEETGLFSQENTRKFYTGLAYFASAVDMLSIWLLYLDGQPLAYEYHLNVGKVDYALKCEYSQEYSKFSPGAVLDAHIVEELSKRATEKYDLLGYKDFHKLRWSNKTEKYIRIYVFKRNPVGQAFHFIEFPLRARLKRISLLHKIKDSLPNIPSNPIYS